MIIPVRCFTCGSLIGDKWDEFKERVYRGEEVNAVLDSLNIKRICCRRMLMSHVDLIFETVNYNRPV